MIDDRFGDLGATPSLWCRGVTCTAPGVCGCSEVERVGSQIAELRSSVPVSARAELWVVLSNGWPARSVSVRTIRHGSVIVDLTTLGIGVLYAHAKQLVAVDRPRTAIPRRRCWRPSVPRSRSRR
jgi:hypothetical protein